MYNIPRYQTGSYIPGLESQIFGAKLDRSIADTQEDLRNKAKKMQKGFLRGKIGKFLTKGAGKWLGSALTKGIAATNPLMALALKAAISSGTQRFGEKLFRGKDVNLNNKSGLLGSQYEDLDEYQKGIDKSARGDAWETFGDEIIGGLKSDYGKQIWNNQLSDDFKTKVFGENIASKSHKELSKMNIGEMLGAEGKLFGAEEKLSDIGERAYEWAGDKGLNTYKWLGDRGLNTYKGIGNIYKGARDFSTDLYGGASDLYRGASDLYKGIRGENPFTYQKGGKVQGYQEGGTAYPLQMAGGGYMPEQGFGGLIQYRKGY